MSDIAAFLLARIAEDEADARAADGPRWHHYDKLVVFEALGPDDEWVDASAPISVDTRANGHHIARWSPSRVLAECAAKREIVERAMFVDGHGPAVGHLRALDMTTGASGALRHVLMALAQPYFDHPDFDPGWGTQR